MALAMPYPMPYPMAYPYALPDDAYAPAPAYHAPALGRVKIQVSFFLVHTVWTSNDVRANVFLRHSRDPPRGLRTILAKKLKIPAKHFKKKK